MCVFVCVYVFAFVHVCVFLIRSLQLTGDGMGFLLQDHVATGKPAVDFLLGPWACLGEMTGIQTVPYLTQCRYIDGKCPLNHGKCCTLGLTV